jgi:hypothetical protein
MRKQLLKPEVQKFIKDHQFDDPFSLSLKIKSKADFPVKEAIEQIHALQKAKLKIPSWIEIDGIIWPAPLSVEQSSSELCARFKTELIHGKSMIDLTGGMGIDTSFFTDCFAEVIYVESNPELAELARHNFKALGLHNISIHCESSEEFLGKRTKQIDAIFIDPSRRVKDKKVFKIEDCTPNLYELTPKCLELSNQLLVKLSPLVDLSLLIKDFYPAKIWVVSIKNEVKEVLCLIQNKKAATQIVAVDLNAKRKNEFFEFEMEEEANAESVFSLPLKYIYEPSSAVMKTGAFKLIGHRFGLQKLHINTHLYTSDEMIENFPGRKFLLKKQIKQDKKAFARLVPDKKINVMTRNYPLSPDQLKKKLSLKDGGENYLIGATLFNGKKAILYCERV